MKQGWQIMKLALADYRGEWPRYLLLTAIVTVPVDLIALSSSLSAAGALAFYTQLASLFMTTALFWAVVHRGDLVGLGVRRSYYEGSAMLLRLILTVIMIAFMLLPAAIGFTLYQLGTAQGSGATIGVQLLLGGLALIFTLPSLMWLVWYGLAVFGVAGGDYPVAALKASRELSRGRFWSTVGRMVSLIVLIFVVGLPGIIVTAVIGLLTHWGGVTEILQAYVSIIVVPIAMLVFHHLYRRLQGASK